MKVSGLAMKTCPRAAETLSTAMRKLSTVRTNAGLPPLERERVP